MTVGMSDTTAQHEAKVALVAAARAALEDEEEVDIQFGFRWPFKHPDWFSVLETDSDVNPAVIGPRMTQDETITINVSVGAWLPGSDEETEVAASARAFELLAKVQRHIRQNDPTLGGTVMWCLLGPSKADGETSDTDSQQGRLAEIAAAFICKHRIRN